MKSQITLITALFLSIFILSAQNKQQEVLIIGTMHTVPKIVKNSYKPMLRFAKNYKPEAIFVEAPMAKDSISWEYLKNGWSKGYQNFYKKSSSLQNSFNFNESKFNRIINKHFKDMNDEDLKYLIKSFIYKRDNGNFELYSYLKKHGIKGAKKATRHEDGDLTYKLALFMNHKRVINIDDQQTNKEYHNAWDKCRKEGTKNGNNLANSKLYKKNYNGAIFPAIFRGLGKHTNKRKSLQQLHDMASFSYVVKKTKGCNDGKKYFDERNMRITKNIAQHIVNSKKHRNVVIIGAAHVIGLEKEFKENYPSLKVILMNEY
ncbi:DUF5694 domain-containing protein [Polaribacter ponticola]|uniref:DUF5694 domain-containing protein n=1 Tax=Polaribacter ponticola TaxID=2978475 RepID=A0ABT5S7D7_9FLAO|nr:DUF5694 domain-containing protein [Polaribacter sp. MSW5]MDD7914015.1 DUF5694 domain-containing protein [Polaribacter sp. MSW5]